MRPFNFPQDGFQLIPADTKFEEETLDQPPSVHYYPTRLGEIFRLRFQVVAKLGYGRYATAWLVRDLWYVARKGPPEIALIILNIALRKA